MFEELPKDHFGCILADPPWTYKIFSKKGLGRSAERHYDTMSVSDIAAMPVVDIAADNCHLFMWVTGPCLVQGMHMPIMEAWGFRPSSMAFVWIKAKIGDYENGCFFLTHDLFVKGMGHTTRQNAEFVVLGRRGKPKRLTKAMPQILVAPRREHSVKPEESYSRIEQYCVGPRLELFARRSRENWTTWGNEATKFDETA